MADLYLHLVFARRLRFAEGLHPLVSEALARRPSLVALGASLAALPGNERRGMSFFRRLFTRAGEVARWQKLLAATPGSPRSDLIAAVMAGEPGAPGGMARLALGLGLLSYELLENAVGGLTASLPPVERAAVERSQARLWLQATLPREKDLAHELQPVLALGDGDATRRMLAHANGALAKVHGSGPGEALLLRWVKSLVAEAALLVEKSALPPPLGADDQAVRGPHYEGPALAEKVQATVNSLVLLADRVGEVFAAGEPDVAALGAALAGARAPEWSQATVDELRERWRAWLKSTRDASMARGRNTKAAFGDGELVPEHRQRGVTSVMSLADLPPEAENVGAPPLPELSGPNVQPSIPPNITQEVSFAQIEAEAHEFASPPHTQEVSVAQIESEAGEFASPPHTQEVTAAQIEAATAPPANVTQPVAMAEILQEQEAEPVQEQPVAPASDAARHGNGEAKPTAVMPTAAVPTDAVPTGAAQIEAMPADAAPSEAAPETAPPAPSTPQENAPGGSVPGEPVRGD